MAHGMYSAWGVRGACCKGCMMVYGAHGKQFRVFRDMVEGSGTNMSKVFNPCINYTGSV